MGISKQEKIRNNKYLFFAQAVFTIGVM